MFMYASPLWRSRVHSRGLCARSDDEICEVKMNCTMMICVHQKRGHITRRQKPKSGLGKQLDFWMIQDHLSNSKVVGGGVTADLMFLLASTSFICLQ